MNVQSNVVEKILILVCKILLRRNLNAKWTFIFIFTIKGGNKQTVSSSNSIEEGRKEKGKWGDGERLKLTFNCSSK